TGTTVVVWGAAADVRGGHGASLGTAVAVVLGVPLVLGGGGLLVPGILLTKRGAHRPKYPLRAAPEGPLSIAPGRATCTRRAPKCPGRPSAQCGRFAGRIRGVCRERCGVCRACTWSGVPRPLPGRALPQGGRHGRGLRGAGSQHRWPPRPQGDAPEHH